MERVFGGTDKIILDSSQHRALTADVVPMLPLNELTAAHARDRYGGSKR